MKKNIIVGIAMAMGILSVGVVAASASESCCAGGKCADKQVVQQFKQETALLADVLKSKDVELRELYGYEGIDLRRVDELEAQIKELKGKIKVVADKFAVPDCCLS